MSHYHSNFWEDLFFPRRQENLKRVVVLSALIGVISVAIANFFSKKVNRENIKNTLNNLSEEARIAKIRIADKTREMSDEYN